MAVGVLPEPTQTPDRHLALKGGKKIGFVISNTKFKSLEKYNYVMYTS